MHAPSHGRGAPRRRRKAALAGPRPAGGGARAGSWLAGLLHDLDVVHPDLRANQLYLQAIGVLHLARSGIGLRVPAGEMAEGFPVSADEVRAACVQIALAAAATV